MIITQPKKGTAMIRVLDGQPEYCSKDCRFCKLETDQEYGDDPIRIFYKCVLYDVTWSNTCTPFLRTDDCVAEWGNGEKESK